MRDGVRALAGLRWYLRELTGETQYDRYLERHAREHAGRAPLSRREFERRRIDGGGSQAGQPLLLSPSVQPRRSFRKEPPPRRSKAGAPRGNGRATFTQRAYVKVALLQPGQSALSSSITAPTDFFASPKSIEVLLGVEQRVVDAGEAAVHRPLEHDHRCDSSTLRIGIPWIGLDGSLRAAGLVTSFAPITSVTSVRANSPLISSISLSAS